MKRGLAGAGFFAGIYAGLLALHAPLLHLPYYWDEAGYYIFAALDFFRHGWLVPRTTLANGHPPLLSLYLSLAWWAGGFHPWVTRSAMLAWAALLIAGVYRLARQRLHPGAAAVVAGLIAIAPLVFAQSTLALLDLPVAALVVWALSFPDHIWAQTALLSLACLMKETAVIVPGTLLLVRARQWRSNLPLLTPAAVLGLWFVYYHHQVGYWFGNPQYFAYNVGQAAFSLPRIGLALLRRLWQLFGYEGTWLLTVLAAWGWRQKRRRGQSSPMPREWLAIIAVFLGFHAVIGGAVLARYLLPALVLYLIWAAEQILALPRAGLWVGACAAILLVSWFWNPPYPFPYEDNLAYVQFVKLHQAAARDLEAHPAAGPVWTAWPATNELTRPELGYVNHPIAVHPVEDFSRASLNAIHQQPERLYLFSREYQPSHNWAQAFPFWRNWSRRFFHDAEPAPETLWLQRLQLKTLFTRHAAGQWVTIAGR